MGTQAKRLTATALVVTALFVAWQPLHESIAIDSCLDSGGSFDYAANACDYEDSHPTGARQSKLYYVLASVCAAAGGILFARSTPWHNDL